MCVWYGKNHLIEIKKYFRRIDYISCVISATLTKTAIVRVFLKDKIGSTSSTIYFHPVMNSNKAFRTNQRLIWSLKYRLIGCETAFDIKMKKIDLMINLTKNLINISINSLSPCSLMNHSFLLILINPSNTFIDKFYKCLSCPRWTWVVLFTVIYTSNSKWENLLFHRF